MATNPDISAAIEHLEKFLGQGDWRARLADYRDALLEPVFAEAQVDVPELFESLEQHGLLTSFAAFVDEAFFCARLEPDGANLIDAYLKRRGWQESPRARAYLQGMRDTTPAVWEVRATAPGAWVEVVDRLADSPVVRVSERSASRTLQRYDRLIARVIPVRDVHMFAGGVLMLTHEMAETLEANLRRLRKRGQATHDSVTATCIQVWTIELLRQLARPRPTLQTTHGESLVLGRTRLQLAPGAAAKDVARRLDDARRQGWVNMADGTEPGWLWFGGEEGADEGDPTGEQRTILATVRPEGSDAWIVETMSQPRMERALESLHRLLGDLVSPGLTHYEDPIQAATATSQRGKRAAAAGSSPGSDEVDPTAAAEIVRQVTEAHYRRTLDEPVPMLGNRTPRACARTKAGRQKLVAWLKFLENAELHRPAAPGHLPYDFGWMWRELGIEDQR
jgi:hypothetical protein